MSEYLDSATVEVDLQVSSVEGYTPFSSLNILTLDDYTKWSYGDADQKWTPVDLNLEMRWQTVKVGVGV